MDDNWSEADVAGAAVQGWRLALVWDAQHRRPEYELRPTDSSFLKTDEAARNLVSQLASRGDKLAVKASGLIFRSKTGNLRAEEKKKPKRKTK